MMMWTDSVGGDGGANTQVQPDETLLLLVFVWNEGYNNILETNLY